MTEAPERLTIDSTVLYDCIHERRPEDRHRVAIKLVELGRAGDVDLEVAGSGWNYDFTQPERETANQIREQLNGAATFTPQLAYVGPHTYPSKTLYPGAYVKGFVEAWAAAVEKRGPGTRPGDADRMHVETLVMHGRDVFISDDEGVLMTCEVLASEGWKIDAVGLADYFGRREARVTGRA